MTKDKQTAVDLKQRYLDYRDRLGQLKETQARLEERLSSTQESLAADRDRLFTLLGVESVEEAERKIEGIYTRLQQAADDIEAKLEAAGIA